MWSLILKSLLQGTWWCNRILSRILFRSHDFFFLLQKVWKLLMSAFLSWLLLWLTSESHRRPKGEAAGTCHPGRCLGAPSFPPGKGYGRLQCLGLVTFRLVTREAHRRFAAPDMRDPLTFCRNSSGVYYNIWASSQAHQHERNWGSPTACPVLVREQAHRRHAAGAPPL